MNFEQKLEELKQNQLQIYNIKKEVLELSSNIFEDFYKHIFQKYTDLKSFSWSQYTPYFNDGDPTFFIVNRDYISVNEDYVEDSNWYSENLVTNWGTWNNDLKIYEGKVEEVNPNYNPVLRKVTLEISTFLGLFDDDFYLSKFGDHANIRVTKDGVDISDYDHD